MIPDASENHLPRGYRGGPNVLSETTDAEVGFVCPGCRMWGLRHPPLCPVAVRLTADAVRALHPADWRERLRTAAEFDELLHGGRWEAVPRHWRCAADEPATEPPHPATPAVVWDAANGVFLEYHAPGWLTVQPKRRLPEWAGRT